MNLSELRRQPHLSASSIGAYLSCSMEYWFSRIKRLPPEFTPDSLVFGTCIHLVLAEFYKARKDGDSMSLEDIQELFRSVWQKQAGERADIQYAEGKSYESHAAEGIELLTVWFKNLPSDSLEVLAVEEAFVFEIDGLPVPVLGIIDLVEEDESGSVVITDHKTSARSYSADEIEQNNQITLYQMAARANGFADREILLKLDCLVKTKVPKFESYWTVRSDLDELRLIRKIQRVWDGIQKEVFIPNTSWKCKSCQYQGACNRWFQNGGGE